MGICPYCELDESVCDRSLGWPQRARCWESAWNLRGIELSATRSKLVLSNHEATALRAENARLRTGLDSMLRIFREETSSGDGIQEGHVAVYEAARAALDAKEGGT